MSGSGSKFLLGFLTGMLAGATIGLLMAPDSGEETVKNLKEKLDQYAEEGKKVYEEYKKKMAKE